MDVVIDANVYAEPDTDFDLQMQQAAMILSALKAGWTVSMNDSKELIFTKDKRRMTPEEHIEVTSDGFSSKFLQSLIKKRVKD